MPIFDQKKIPTVILSKLRKDGSEDVSSVSPSESIGDESLHAIAEDLLHAVETKSVAGVVSAIRAMVLELESEE